MNATKFIDCDIICHRFHYKKEYINLSSDFRENSLGFNSLSKTHKLLKCRVLKIILAKRFYQIRRLHAENFQN